jgi:hypothetical protein
MYALRALRMMHMRIIWCVLIGPLVWGCGSPMDGHCCAPESPSAVVHGHVQLASGAPVSGATISAYIARSDGCVARNFPDAQTLTEGDGDYGLGVVGVTDTASICVLVRISPPNGSGFGADVDSQVQLAFRRAQPLDSAEVNATLGTP